MNNICFIGVGMGSSKMLTSQAIEAIKNSDIVFAFGRVAQSLQDVRNDIVLTDYSQLTDKIKECKKSNIAVLVSGDVGFFSASKALQNNLETEFNITRICGINSLQYLCAKACISYEDVKNVSLHGRGSFYSLLGSITHNEKTFVLCGGKNSTTDILKFLTDKVSEDVTVIIGENLSAQDEKITQGSIKTLVGQNCSELSVLLFVNKTSVQTGKVYFDTAFIRAKAPMTKQHVRWASVNTLNINANDIVFDIGAGTGSVAIEMAARAHEGVVFAIEKNEETFNLLCENISKMRTFNVLPKHGKALEIIKTLKTPNKVFIGGSTGQLSEIVDFLYIENPDVTIVINAITLETLAQACGAFEKNNRRYSVICLNSAYSKELQNYHMMTANNPIYIITGE